MTADNILEWFRENPRAAAEDLTRMCNDRSFNFVFSDRCHGCPYDCDEGCDTDKLAEELENL